MWENRPNSTFVVLFIVLAVALGCYLYRSDIQSGQIWQKISRLAVGQEIRFRTARFQEMKTDHFVIKFTQTDADYAAIIANSAERAYRQVSDRMNIDVRQKTTIVVYPDSRSLARCFGWDKNEKALGVYWAGTIRILSPHEWLQQAYNEAEFQTEGPLVHEYVHLIVDDMTGGNYNRWWTEGVAQYIEKQITGFQFADPQDVTAGQLYTFQELNKNFDELDQQMSYWQSRQAVEFMASQYGEEVIYTVMDYLAQGDTLYQAIEKATGTDFENFAYQCYRYMEKQ
ncbi:MAG TPA: hypothetical protein PLC88_03300 [Syntrophomonas sp.]|nr:hypothetical protein [Syntrophomonas sp.]HRW13345.1 hypothetical protein [Syntrophomonas sp.]